MTRPRALSASAATSAADRKDESGIDLDRLARRLALVGATAPPHLWPAPESGTPDSQQLTLDLGECGR